MEKKRNSNIELLRCFAMLMIISHHIVNHCVILQLTNINSIERMQNGYFNHPLFYKKLLILEMLSSFGGIGNAIFMLISGYFMVQKRSLDIVKISSKLISQLGFSAVFLILLSIGSNFMDALAVVNVQSFNQLSWYVGYYYAVILIARFFLNDFLGKMNDKNYITFLIICFSLTQFGWTGILLDGFVPGLRTLLTGIFLYALGGYIRKNNYLSRIRTYVFVLTIFITYSLVFISAYNVTQSNIHNYINEGIETDYIQNISSFSNYSIVVIIVGICIFEIFRRIKISNVKVLNYCGQATFMVYLLHDNELFYSIWNTQDWITLLYAYPYKFIIKLLIWSGSVFVCGIVIYSLYKMCSWLLKKLRIIVG